MNSDVKPEEREVVEAWRAAFCWNKPKYRCARFGCGARTSNVSDRTERCRMLIDAGPHDWVEMHPLCSDDSGHFAMFRRGFEAGRKRTNEETSEGKK